MKLYVLLFLLSVFRKKNLVFLKSYKLQKNILAPIDEELGFDFGYSIDVNGDLMLIGAPHRTDLVGRAYLYQKDYKDRWQLIEIISPSSDNWTSDFGSQVKINDLSCILILSPRVNP